MALSVWKGVIYCASKVATRNAIEIFKCELGIGPGFRQLPFSRRQLRNNRQRDLKKVQSGFVLWGAGGQVHPWATRTYVE